MRRLAIAMFVVAAWFIGNPHLPPETWAVAIDGHWAGYLYDVRFADGTVKEVRLIHSPLMLPNTVWNITLHKHLWSEGNFYEYDVISAEKIPITTTQRQDQIGIPQVYNWNREIFERDTAFRESH